MIQLKPEMYRMLVKSMLATDGPPDFETKLDQQYNLARLMRVSKLLNTICEPLIYEDCLVGDINVLVQDLEPESRKESLLNQVTTLRLYHPFTQKQDEIDYHLLMAKANWAETGSKRSRHDHEAQLRLARNDESFAAELWGRPAANILNAERSRIEDTGGVCIGRVPRDKPAFGKLQRVVMTGVGDQSWGKFEGDDCMPGDIIPLQTQDYLKTGWPIARMLRPIPHFLLGSTPSVKYYCQTNTSGPFAMGNHILQPDYPPEIVTYHSVRMPTPSEAQKGEFGLIQPIVLGAINRYMMDAPHIVLTDSRATLSTMQAYFLPLLWSLAARAFTLYWSPVSWGTCRFNSTSQRLDCTTIEVYNYCQHIYLEDPLGYGPIPGPKYSSIEDLQAILDQLIEAKRDMIGMWKGKVFLKKSEDAPPCAACGLTDARAQVELPIQDSFLTDASGGVYYS